MTLFGAVIAGLMVGVGLCYASEVVPRLSPSFPAHTDSVPIWDPSSLWLRWHLGTIVLCGITAGVLFTKSSETFWITGALTAFFGLIVLIDLKYHLIPNVLTYPALVVIVAARIPTNNADMRSLLLGLAFTAVIFGMTAWLQPGNLGGGDIKLALVMGALFGFPSVLLALLVGVGTGAIAAILLLRGKGKTAKMAYAPYLCLGAFVILLFSP